MSNEDAPQTTRYQAAVVAACKAGDTHLTCSFPNCGCKTLPKQMRAGLEEFCCGDAACFHRSSGTTCAIDRVVS